MSSFADRVIERAAELRSNEQLLSTDEEAELWWVRVCTALAKRPQGRSWNPVTNRFSEHAVIDRTRLPVLPTAVSFIDNLGFTSWLVLDLDTKTREITCENCELAGRESSRMTVKTCTGCIGLNEVRWEHNAAVRTDAARLSLILDEYQLPWFADVADSNGVHIYAKLPGPVHFKHLAPILNSFKLITPTMDPSVLRNKQSTIRPTGSRTKSMLTYQSLIVPESQAIHAMGTLPAPAGLDAMLSDIDRGWFGGFGEIPVRRQVDTAPAGGHFGISARIRALAASGEYGDRYDSPSEARFAIVASYVRAGATLESFKQRMRTQELAGYVRLLARKCDDRWAEMDRVTAREWASAIDKTYVGALEARQDTRTGAGGAVLSLHDERTAAWYEAAAALDPNSQVLRSVVGALARIHLRAREEGGGKTSGFQASCRYVAMASEVSAVSVWRAMKKLEEAGLLRCLTRGTRGREHPSSWALVIPRTWRQHQGSTIPHRDPLWMGKDLDLRAKRIWELLGEGMTSVRGIATETGMDPKTVRARLNLLLDKKLASRDESGWHQVQLAEADPDGALRAEGRKRRESRAGMIMTEIDEFRRTREMYAARVLHEVNVIIAEAEAKLRAGEVIDTGLANAGSRIPVLRCSDWTIGELDEESYDYLIEHEEDGFLQMVDTGLVYGKRDVWRAARARVDAGTPPA